MIHEIDFRTSTDTGEIDGDSIAPVQDGENARQVTLRRPTEHNRARSEILRKLQRQHLILQDVDRGGLLAWGGGTITFDGAYTPPGGEFISYSGQFTITSDLYLGPFASAADGVGATAPYIASTPATLTIGTFGNNQIIFTSVKKQFEGSAQAKADANRISVEILQDTSLTIALEGATGDVNNVKITITAATTVSELVNLVNLDPTVSDYVSAAKESTSGDANLAPLWGPTEWGSDYSQRFLKGGVPGIVHKITAANLAAFFAMDADYVLHKGDTLAIWYENLIDESGVGGRFQSTVENAKIDIPAASLFITRLFPERVPNSVPVCKCVDTDTIIFVNGAYIKRGAPATLEFDSGKVNSAELGLLAEPLDWVRIDEGAHDPPTTIREALDNTDYQVDAILDEIEDARSSSVFAGGTPYGSIDDRIEANDWHSRTFISVTDGDFALGSTGGMYNSASGLQTAITALQSGGVGGRILVRRGNYTIDAALNVTVPIQIIAVEKGVNVTVSQGSGYALTIASTTSSSNITHNIISGITFSGAAKNIISLTGDNILVESCYFNTVALGIRVNGKNCRVRNCTISTDFYECILVYSAAKACSITACRFESNTTGYAAVHFYGGGSVESPNILQDCEIICVSDTTAIGSVKALLVDTAAQHTIIRNLHVQCEPSDNSSTSVITINNGRTIVENVNMIVPNATTDIRRPLFVADTLSNEEEVRIRNLTVDLGYNWLKYNSVDKGPLQFIGNVVVEELNFSNMQIPCTTTQGYSLSRDNPILRLEGVDYYKPVYLRGGHIHTIQFGSDERDGSATIIGASGDGNDRGSTGIARAFHVSRVKIDTSLCSESSGSATPVGNIYIFANVPVGSTIDDCDMACGFHTAAIWVYGCDNLAAHTRANITNNKIKAITVSGLERGIAIRSIPTANIKSTGITVRGNTINIAYPANACTGIGLTGVAAALVNGIIITDNHVTEIGSGSSGCDAISLYDTTQDYIAGNVLAVQSGNNHIYDPQPSSLIRPFHSDTALDNFNIYITLA